MNTKFPLILTSALTVAATLIIGQATAGPQTRDVQRKTVWSGVYTAAQAARGQAEYQKNCMGCHKTESDPINPESRLKGDDFMERWREDDLDSLFSLIKATMPRRDPGSLSDSTYVDIVTYLLKENGFPADAQELNVDLLRSIRMEGKDGPRPLSSGALVQMVGCLTMELGQDKGVWILTNASEPIRTRMPRESTPVEIEAATAQPLGTQTFRLQNLDYFTQFLGRRLDANTSQKMHVKGYLVRQPNRQRLDITYLETVAASCRP